MDYSQLNLPHGTKQKKSNEETKNKPLNGFAPNSQGRRIWSGAWRSFKVKVKDQSSRSPGTKNGIFGPFSGLYAVFVW